MKRQFLVIVLFSCVFFITGCMQERNTESVTLPTRESKIPSSAVKITPANDSYPPQLHTNEFMPPAPLPDLVNTAGAEDSPFITSDGSEFYFFSPPM